MLLIDCISGKLFGILWFWESPWPLKPIIIDFASTRLLQKSQDKCQTIWDTLFVGFWNSKKLENMGKMRLDFARIWFFENTNLKLGIFWNLNCWEFELLNWEIIPSIFSWPWAMSLEPRVLRHELWALSYWWSIDWWIIRLFVIGIRYQVLGIRY